MLLRNNNNATCQTSPTNYFIYGADRGAGSVFKLGGRGRPGFHGMQLPITHRVLVIRGAATS